MTIEKSVTSKTVNINREALLALANQHHGKDIDADLRGTPITDFDALMYSAMGPALMRLINLATTRSPDAAISEADLPALAAEAFSQAVDYNFAQEVITDYGILLNPEGYGRHTRQLLALAREHRPVLCMRS